MSLPLPWVALGELPVLSPLSIVPMCSPCASWAVSGPDRSRVAVGWITFPLRVLSSGPKNSLNIKFLGGIFLGHPGPRRRDIPDKNFMQVAFFCCFRQGVAGMSRDLGRDVPDLEKLYARKLWADFSYPISATSMLSKNSRVLGAKSRLKSANLS